MAELYNFFLSFVCEVGKTERKITERDETENRGNKERE